MEDRIRYVFQGFFNVHWRRSKDPQKVPGPHWEAPRAPRSVSVPPGRCRGDAPGTPGTLKRAPGGLPSGPRSDPESPGTSPKRSEGV